MVDKINPANYDTGYNIFDVNNVLRNPIQVTDDADRMTGNGIHGLNGKTVIAPPSETNIPYSDLIQRGDESNHGLQYQKQFVYEGGFKDPSDPNSWVDPPILEKDAFRHIYSAAVYEYYYGRFVSTAITAAHEYWPNAGTDIFYKEIDWGRFNSDMNNSLTHASHNMDFTNNNYGVALAQYMKDNNISIEQLPDLVYQSIKGNKPINKPIITNPWKAAYGEESDRYIAPQMKHILDSGSPPAHDFGYINWKSGLPSSSNLLINQSQTKLYDASKDIKGHSNDPVNLDELSGERVDLGADSLGSNDLASGQPKIASTISSGGSYKQVKKKVKKKASLFGIIFSFFVEVFVTIFVPSSHAETVSGSIVGMSYPLLLDLDGDGIETISYEDSKAAFDFTGDGYAQKTGWVSKDDAILAIDKNENGIIDDVNEQFGFVDKGGFDELAALDSNGDNLIDQNDALFHLLRVWQDANEDGVTDEGELKTLSEAGIESISLETSDENFEENGNIVFKSATFKWTNGSTGTIYDVAFQASPSYTQYKGDYVIDVELISLPWLRGYGSTKDLLVEATENADLKAFLRGLSSESNPMAIYNQMDTLLSKWAGVGEIEPSAVSSQGLIDFVIKYLGMDFTHDLTNDPNYYDTVKEVYQDLKNKLFVDYIAQTQVGASLGISYNFLEDTYIVSNTFYTNLVENLTNTQSAFATFLIGQVLEDALLLDNSKLINVITERGYGQQLYDYLRKELDFIPPDVNGDVSGDSPNNLLFPTKETGGTFTGGDGDDFLVSTAGDDTLQGGAGNDTYVIDLFSGRDVIEDSAGIDTLLLGAGITKDNLVLSQDGNDLILTVGAQEIAAIQDWFTSPSIETLRFIDGQSLTSTEITNMSIHITGTASAETLTGNNFANGLSGDAGDDTLYGGAGNDTLDGGSGADLMVGGRGNETYIVDHIDDVVVEGFAEGVDTLYASVSYALSDHVENLVLTGEDPISGTGNSLNNTLTGNANNNTLDGGAGADTLIGGLGDDTYIVDNVADVIIENPSEGSDMVLAHLLFRHKERYSLPLLVTQRLKSHIHPAWNTFKKTRNLRESF